MTKTSHYGLSAAVLATFTQFSVVKVSYCPLCPATDMGGGSSGAVLCEAVCQREDGSVGTGAVANEHLISANHF